MSRRPPPRPGWRSSGPSPAGYDIANKPDGATQSLGNLIATTNSLTNLPSGGFVQYLGAVLFTLGGLEFSFLVPALAGDISFAIADRACAPGFTAGAVAVFVGGGFIGGIVGGLIAGFTALWISKIAVPKAMRGLMPVVIIPLDASLVVSLMMCFHLGGPVDKAAYAFATAGLNVADPSSLRIMAAVMAAGMVPPLAMALASTVRPKLSPSPSVRMAVPHGFSAHRSSPRVPSRSPRRTRCASSRR